MGSKFLTCIECGYSRLPIDQGRSFDDCTCAPECDFLVCSECFGEDEPDYSYLGDWS